MILFAFYSVLDYLIWHHFGHNSEARAHDLINTYKHYFSSEMNAANMAKLAEQYIWRQAINMDRETNVDQKGDTKTLKVRYQFGLYVLVCSTAVQSGGF